MSRQINQPINQVRLTNVAIVRMNKGGKRFEIACYRNKVVNYRQGIETDLSEVMQSERVFVNVSKGEFAKVKELKRVFGTTDEEAVIKIILNKGDLQVSDLERNQQYESMYREIATWISEHCVHPITQRPYTVPQIRQAMKQAEYTIHPTWSMKKQYLDCFKRIQQRNVLPLERAKMELQFTYSQESTDQVNGFLHEHQLQPSTSKERGNNNESALMLLINPSLYRLLEDLAKEVQQGRIEILRQVVRREGDLNLEEEMAEKEHQSQQQQQQDENIMTQRFEAQVGLDHDETTSNAGVVKPPNNNQHNNNDDEDDENGLANEVTPLPTRKSQKKAQKKSKKAKRREKEEAAQRQARIDAETKRREERETITTLSNGASATVTASSQGGGKACNTCGGFFPNMADYRAHFRSDWHRYNIKLKMKGIPPVSEREFLLCDSDAFFEDTMP